MSNPYSKAVFCAVLVVSGFLTGYFTNDWVRGPKVNEADLIERYVFSNEYGARMERWIAASFKVEMLSAISQGELVHGFLDIALDDLKNTIDEMKLWASRAPNDSFKAALEEDIEHAESVYEQAKHNKAKQQGPSAGTR